MLGVLCRASLQLGDQRSPGPFVGQKLCKYSRASRGEKSSLGKRLERRSLGSWARTSAWPSQTDHGGKSGRKEEDGAALGKFLFYEIPSSSESFSPSLVSLALSSEAVITPFFCLSIMDKAVRISFSGSSCFICLYIIFRKVEKSNSAFLSGKNKGRFFRNGSVWQSGSRPKHPPFPHRPVPLLGHLPLFARLLSGPG